MAAAIAGPEDAGADDAAAPDAGRGGTAAVPVDDADFGPGSGFMMLTGGIEADVGKSALVGLPVGTEEESNGAGAAKVAGAFHVGA